MSATDSISPSISALEDLHSVEQLESWLSPATSELVAAMGRLKGDLLVLGVGGKMGPTLALMAKRASEEAGVPRRILGAARFSEPGLEERLQSYGIETLRCDLLDHDPLDALPDAPNIVYMAGMKFGSTGNEALTWAMNCYLPGRVCERFPGSRIAAFSTGNIYGLSPATAGGSVETDVPDPVGDYAMSCLGRERIFQHFSNVNGTPTVLIRLNYAIEPRYGVLVDIARKVWSKEPVDLAMGYFNCIWQPSANALILRALELAASPAEILNVVGPETLRVRDVAEAFGRHMERKVEFSGEEAPSALLSHGGKMFESLGKPEVGVDSMIECIAAWVMKNGLSLNKPTHFESRDGSF
jgi:nucleoside-diphosphate-sugar epimerase